MITSEGSIPYFEERKYYQRTGDDVRKNWLPSSRMPKKKLMDHCMNISALIELFQCPFNFQHKEDQQQIISCSLEMFLKKLWKLLASNRIKIPSHGIRLSGSVASTILRSSEGDALFDQVNDIDINIYIEDGGENTLFRILMLVEELLAQLCEEQLNKIYSPKEISEFFFQEMIKVVSPHEKWSLISIGNGKKNIDIKFIQKTKRSYVFSTDSFEIILNPILRSCSIEKSLHLVYFHSLYGDLDLALHHLNENILHIKNPDQIRRGIFRLCLEFSKGRKFENLQEEENVINSFCTQFAEEFKTVSADEFRNILLKLTQKHPNNSQNFFQTMYKILCSHQLTSKMESHLFEILLLC